MEDRALVLWELRAHSFYCSGCFVNVQVLLFAQIVFGEGRCLLSLSRSIRTLCDHAGTGSELTFCKGEELVVLGGVNQDWIRCRQGDREGLVPIGYTSLIM